ncbi:hypothetical protein [Deinococcus yunweiensis]|uniref:hypothetical protein n=1 Tax=Deinococcus yunweiensis TaxID=367282 RepID=UPI00398F8DAF
MIEMRGADGQWGNLLPVVTDFDDPTWSTALTQEQTPYGYAWVDGSPDPQTPQLPVRIYVGARSVGECDRRTDAALHLLLTGTGWRDLRRSQAYLITQGLLGRPEVKRYRGGCLRLITATLALRDPYWHTSDDDGSTRFTPI